MKRGGSVAVTIPYEDLAAHETAQEVPDALSIRRTQEVDLPARVTVNFANVDGDYQVGSEKSERLVTSSRQQSSIDLALAIDADKGAQIADVLLFDAYASRTPIRFSTTKKYAKYQPTDVVTVVDPTASYRVRIAKKDESGPLINWEAVTDDATIYTSSVIGGTIGQTQTQVTTPGPTRAEFLDIPIIRDQHDDAGFYVALGGYKSAWRGAALYRSADGSTYVNVASASNTATLGTCDTTLGDWTGGNFFDEKNTLDVTLTSGTLSSYTHDQVLDGANAALVGSEIIQFKTATLLGTNQYRLSGLLRGRRGTEQHIATHAGSETFVLLTVAGTVRPNEGSAAIGAERYYQAVSFGQTRSGVATETFTNTAVGLKPYAPVHFSGGQQANGDYAIAWIRRARTDGGWRDLVDVPLDEVDESYEVDVMDGDDVVRTFSSSEPTVTYTTAQQIADFGTIQNSISVNVYQISATVGRGFPGGHVYMASGNDPLWSSVQLLLHGEGVNGGTAFVDSSDNNATLTRTGSIVTSTSRSRYGAASIYVPSASGQKLQLPNESKYKGAGVSWTFEASVYATSFSANRVLYDGNTASTNTTGPVIYIDAAGKLALYSGAQGVNFGNAGAGLTASAWNDIAVTWDGTTLRFFANGVLESAATGFTNVWGSSGPSLLGDQAFVTADSLNGYADEIRFTRGAARYIGNYTPGEFVDY